jgi:hypothetical protein
MKHTIILILFSLFYFQSFAQLDKKTWIVGGSGTFSSVNDDYSSTTVSTEYTRTYLQMNPSIGYLVKDKFAVGIKTSLSWSKNKGLSDGTSGTDVSKRLDYGPFVRYYFLNKEKSYNLLTDISYQLGNLKLTNNSGTRKSFSAMAGSVIYFNSSVGLELLMGYRREKEQLTKSVGIPPFYYTDIKKGFQFSIGFQIHLTNY